MNTPRDTPFQRRAGLRKATAEQTPLPETMGDTRGPDMASMIFTGVPEQGAAEAGTKLAGVLADHSNFLVRQLRPIMSASAWEKFVALLAKGAPK